MVYDYDTRYRYFKFTGNTLTGGWGHAVLRQIGGRRFHGDSNA